MKTVLKRNLGTVILRTNGTGSWGRDIKSWPVTIQVSIEPESIDIVDGRVEFVYGSFEALFAEKDCVEFPDEHPYTDRGFEKGLNDFMATIGMAGAVCWSEQGKQDAHLADFDCAYSIYERAFPDAFAAARQRLAA